MTPIETSDPSSALVPSLDAFGADHEIAGCPECGRALVEGAPCDCTAPQSAAERHRLSLSEVLDGDLVALQADGLWRIQLRGEVIA